MAAPYRADLFRRTGLTRLSAHVELPGSLTLRYAGY
jgi:hypothetical protein